MKKFILSVFCLLFISMPALADNNPLMSKQGKKAQDAFNAKMTASFVVPAETPSHINSYQPQYNQANTTINKVDNTLNQINSINDSIKSLVSN